MEKDETETEYASSVEEPSIIEVRELREQRTWMPLIALKTFITRRDS